MVFRCGVEFDVRDVMDVMIYSSYINIYGVRSKIFLLRRKRVRSFKVFWCVYECECVYEWL